MIPRTRYAKSGGLSIAYQVAGDGPVDIVLVQGFVSHLELAWETPAFAPIYQRLASIGRLIVFDKRGVGLSDRTARLPTLEERMDDVRAVMDAAGSERAALIDAVEEFLTGERPQQPIDRVLKTVLFTDIVGSTQRAAEIGDHRWRTLLDAHDAMVRREIARARGHDAAYSANHQRVHLTTTQCDRAGAGTSAHERDAAANRSTS
jgi:hypothetical protein